MAKSEVDLFPLEEELLHVSFDEVMASVGHKVNRNGWKLSKKWTKQNLNKPKLSWTSRVPVMFKLACMFLDKMGAPIAQVNYRNPTSYGLKHIVQRWAKRIFGKEKNTHVSNGVMIVALISRGFAPEKLWKHGNTPNVMSRISTKRLNKLLKEHNI